MIHLVSGNLDDLAQPNTMLVFESQVEKLKVKVGDAVTISAQTTRGTANTVDCRIVAIAKDMGLLSKFGVFVPVATTRALYQLRPDTTGRGADLPAAAVPAGGAAHRRAPARTAGGAGLVGDGGGSAAVLDEVPEQSAREDWTGQKLDVTTWDDEISFLTWTLDVAQRADRGAARPSCWPSW